MKPIVYLAVLLALAALASAACPTGSTWPALSWPSLTDKVIAWDAATDTTADDWVGDTYWKTGMFDPEILETCMSAGRDDNVGTAAAPLKCAQAAANDPLWTGGVTTGTDCYDTSKFNSHVVNGQCVGTLDSSITFGVLHKRNNERVHLDSLVVTLWRSSYLQEEGFVANGNLHPKVMYTMFCAEDFYTGTDHVKGPGWGAANTDLARTFFVLRPDGSRDRNGAGNWVTTQWRGQVLDRTFIMQIRNAVVGKTSNAGAPLGSTGVNYRQIWARELGDIHTYDTGKSVMWALKKARLPTGKRVFIMAFQVWCLESNDLYGAYAYFERPGTTHDSDTNGDIAITNVHPHDMFVIRGPTDSNLYGTLASENWGALVARAPNTYAETANGYTYTQSIFMTKIDTSDANRIALEPTFMGSNKVIEQPQMAQQTANFWLNHLPRLSTLTGLSETVVGELIQDFYDGTLQTTCEITALHDLLGPLNKAASSYGVTQTLVPAGTNGYWTFAEFKFVFLESTAPPFWCQEIDPDPQEARSIEDRSIEDDKIVERESVARTTTAASHNVTTPYILQRAVEDTTQIPLSISFILNGLRSMEDLVKGTGYFIASGTSGTWPNPPWWLVAGPGQSPDQSPFNIFVSGVAGDQATPGPGVPTSISESGDGQTLGGGNICRGIEVDNSNDPTQNISGVDGDNRLAANPGNLLGIPGDPFAPQNGGQCTARRDIDIETEPAGDILIYGDNVPTFVLSVNGNLLSSRDISDGGKGKGGVDPYGWPEHCGPGESCSIRWKEKPCPYCPCQDFCEPESPFSPFSSGDNAGEGGE